jgi:hypothetical protein
MADWHVYARGTGRAFFSLVVASLFLMALLVSSAQQEVLGRLDNDMSYSVARRVVANATAAEADLRAAATEHRALGKAKRDAEQRLSDLKGLFFTNMQTVDSVAENAIHAKLCPRLNADALPTDPLARWGAVYGCSREGLVVKGDVEDVEWLVDPKNDPTEIDQKAKRAEFDVQSIEQQIAASDARMKADQETLTQAKQVSDTMQIVTLLDESFIGWVGLTSVPPALMQILLCFFSGLFGALLITLVLLVYPNNGLSFAQTNSFWNRILLGGLIAVGVYVVMAGGIAVLGSSDAAANGQHNFLSFAAIGMLAGGFSDKFAQWLSDIATMLVSTTPDPVPAPDVDAPGTP